MASASAMVGVDEGAREAIPSFDEDFVRRRVPSAGFVLGLVPYFATGGCGSDDGGTETPDTQPCSDACSEGARECGGNAVVVCERTANGCLAWADEQDCGAGARCEEGACDPCPDGCCGTCEAYVCGPGSDDGCGRSCGEAVDASDLPEDLTDTICATVVPCCSSRELLCLWDSMSECQTFYNRERVTTLWCTSAVDACLGALERLDCATFGNFGVPDVCVDLYEGRYEVQPATGPCEVTSEQRCGRLGACVDVARSATNCGECGYICGEGDTCQNGVCGTCGAFDEPCCADDACQEGVCTDGVCSIPACQQPVTAPDPPGAPCPQDCADALSRGLLLSCLDMNGVPEEQYGACMDCADQAAQYCGQGAGCGDSVTAYRCCMDACAPGDDCELTCSTAFGAFLTCAHDADCYRLEQNLTPFLGCFQ